jgi:hypothetical protein
MLPVMKRFGKITICGAISGYNEKGMNFKNWFEVYSNRITIKGEFLAGSVLPAKFHLFLGFIYFNYLGLLDQARNDFGTLGGGWYDPAFGRGDGDRCQVRGYPKGMGAAFLGG